MSGVENGLVLELRKKIVNMLVRGSKGVEESIL
jgi:hypothetical protein